MLEISNCNYHIYIFFHLRMITNTYIHTDNRYKAENIWKLKFGSSWDDYPAFLSFKFCYLTLQFGDSVDWYVAALSYKIYFASFVGVLLGGIYHLTHWTMGYM